MLPPQIFCESHCLNLSQTVNVIIFHWAMLRNWRQLFFWKCTDLLKLTFGLWEFMSYLDSTSQWPKWKLRWCCFRIYTCCCSFSYFITEKKNMEMLFLRAWARTGMLNQGSVPPNQSYIGNSGVVCSKLTSMGTERTNENDLFKGEWVPSPGR